MATKFSTLLTELGLSKMEAVVYLSSLEVGPTSVQDIATRAHISRTAAYEVIESLQRRGLFSAFTRGKKRFFSAEDPERIAQYFREHVDTLARQVGDFQRALPELLMTIGGDQPAVRFFEGREAVHALFSDLAAIQPKTMDEISNADDAYDIADSEYLDSVRQSSLNPKKMQTRILYQGHLRRTPRAGVEFCQMPASTPTFHGNIWIYGNRVAFSVFTGKMMAVIVESQHFADTARVLFETAWRICPRPTDAEVVA